MQQYAVCCEDLNEIQHHLQECDDDLYDSIESHKTLNVEIRMKALQILIQIRMKLMIFLRIWEPLILNEMRIDEYRVLVQTLNKKQREFFTMLYI